MLRSADASLLGLGTQMLSEVAAGVLLGIAGDYFLGTKGRWVVVGSIMGIGVAMWSVIRVALRMQSSPRSLRKSGVEGERANSDEDAAP